MYRPSITEINILLIEPSDTQAKIIDHMLEDAEVNHVEIVKTVAQAKQALLEHTIDLVISTMYLSDGRGLHILEHLKSSEETEKIPFMLISSEKNKAILESYKQSGVAAFLPKPFDLEHLEQALDDSVQFLGDDELELEHFDIESVRVLLVDDSKMARSHIKHTIESMGVRTIIEAPNGSHALTELKSQEFDIVVTDYNMPEMDGRELSEFIRYNPNTAHIPILMITSEDKSSSHLNNIDQTGVDAVCAKPFTVDDIRSLFIRLLDQ